MFSRCIHLEYNKPYGIDIQCQVFTPTLLFYIFLLSCTYLLKTCSLLSEILLLVHLIIENMLKPMLMLAGASFRGDGDDKGFEEVSSLDDGNNREIQESKHSMDWL